MVDQIQELRRKAALCRRAASIPTSGSGGTDRILLVLAEQLEHEAVELERTGNMTDRRRPRRPPQS
jgi:hypothetical protein